MARIDPIALNCVFYLYPTEAAAKSGQKIGGSGFWVIVYSDVVENFKWIYAVSNRHVVHQDGAYIIRANGRDGAVKTLDLDQLDWVEHPKGHDLAVCAMDGSRKDFLALDIAAVPVSIFAHPNYIATDLIGVGDDVFMVGRFINHEGKAKNTPSARFGNISMLPGEPIYIDSQSPAQESFAVELRSMCGYSGSPVFITPKYRPDHLREQFMPTELLLGVHWGHIVDPLTVEKRIVKIAKASALSHDEREIDQVAANSGMNGVVPAWRLLELLNLPRFKDVREREERERLEQKKREIPGAKQDSVLQNRSASSPTNTEALSGKAAFNSLLGAAARKWKKDG